MRAPSKPRGATMVDHRSEETSVRDGGRGMVEGCLTFVRLFYMVVFLG